MDQVLNMTGSAVMIARKNGRMKMSSEKQIPDGICPKCKSTEDWTKLISKEKYEYMGWKYKDDYCFDCDVYKVENEEGICG